MTNKKTTLQHEQTVDIRSLQQDDHNFNRGTTEGKRLMDKSFQELGAGRSILIDKNGKIIAGNKSQQAAIDAGITKVRVIETTGDELVAVKRTDIDIDSEKGRKLALADNATTAVNLNWDETELQNVAANEYGIDASQWGVDIPEAATPVEDVETKEDNFEPDEEIIENICKTGDLWTLGNHILMCGDSTKLSDVQKLMNGTLADLWLTDPPYGVDYTGGTGMKIMNDRLKDETFLKFLTQAFNAACECMKKGAAFYIWHAPGPLQALFIQAINNTEHLGLHQQIIWRKNALVLGRSDYQYIHEPCFYGWKEGAPHYFISLRNQTSVLSDEIELDIDHMKKEEMRELLHKIYESPIPTTVIDELKPPKSELHPTMKPIRLFARLIVNSSKSGQTVLDTFGGSGTTIMACEQLGRKCRTMELDPHYCDVIIKRWEKFTGKKAELINSNNNG